MAREPATLDPNMNESVDGMIYITHLYEGLYRPNTDGSFSLGQAKEITITDNPGRHGARGCHAA